MAGRNKYNKRIYDRWYRYGIRQYEYEYKLLEQGFECPICGSALHSKNAHVDHDHDTGENRQPKQVRGILCTNCNMGLGHLKDDPEIVDRAKQYLNKNRH